MKARELAPFDLATTKGHFPVGIDFEIYSASKMAELHRGGFLTTEDREHLTLHFYRRIKEYRVIELKPPNEWRSNRSYTVDTLEDYTRARNMVEALGNGNFSVEEIVGLP